MNRQGILRLTPLTWHRPGVIASLLQASYADLFVYSHAAWEAELQAFQRLDREAFAYPETVGQSIFIAMLGEYVIGLGAFDSHSCPDLGIIRHLCVLPAFRGQGLGKHQMEEILLRLKQRGCTCAVVSAGDHPCFEPARRTYLSCGFKERRRNTEPRGRHGIFKMIEYARPL